MSITAFAAVMAAFVGAASSGFFGIFDRWSERRRKRLALMAEIAAHARFLTNLIREQGYARDIDAVSTASKSVEWDGELCIIMPKSDFLEGLRTATFRAGELSPDIAGKVIEFYHRCVLFLDSTNPDERYLLEAPIDARRSHAIETAKNIELLIKLGDELDQVLK